MMAKPLVLLGKSSKHRIEEKLSSSFKNWASEWLVEEFAFTISVLDKLADDLVDNSQIYLHRDELGNVLGYSVLPLHDLTNLTSSLFLGKELKIRGKALPPTLSQLLETALAELFSILNNYQDITVLTVKHHQDNHIDDAQHFVPVEINLIGKRFILMMPSDIVRWSYIEPAYDIQMNENSRLAVLSQKIKANVTIGNIELTVDMLSQLRKGNTIEMDKKLDEPLSIVFTGTELSFSGFLGKHNNQYAFKINQ